MQRQDRLLRVLALTVSACIAETASAGTIKSVDPKADYKGQACGSAPTIFDLSSEGISSGDVIEITRSGYVSWGTGYPCQATLMGTFAENNSPPYNQIRAKAPDGSWATIQPHNACNCITDADMEINESTCDASDNVRVVVPAGAAYLLFGNPDGYLCDNGAPGGSCTGDPMDVTVTRIGREHIYVDDDATGADDGSSWTDAFPYLTDALEETCGCTREARHEVWVASGSYYPDESASGDTNDPADTFTLCDGVALYGAFDGTESTLGERDTSDQTAWSVLSGDIHRYAALDETTCENADYQGVFEDGKCWAYYDLDGDDVDETRVHRVFNVGQSGGATDNTSHIVTADDVGATTVLDGFRIEFGFGLHGSGLFAERAEPQVANCRFQYNFTRYFASPNGGAAVYISCPGDGQPETSPSFSNCIFESNVCDLGTPGQSPKGWGRAKNTRTNGADWAPVAIVYRNSNDEPANPQFADCTFSNNLSGAGGAVNLALNTGTAAFEDCTFNRNVSLTSGGGIHVGLESNCTVYGCEFDGNFAGTAWTDPPDTAEFYGGGAIGGIGGTIGAQHPVGLTVTDSTFTDNAVTFYDAGADGEYGGGAILMRGNWVLEVDGTEPASIVGCTFDGNTSAAAGGAVYIGNAPTLGANLFHVQRCYFHSNEAELDGGAVYVMGNHSNTSNKANFTSCQFHHNDNTGGAATTKGGAAYVTSGNAVTFQNCTFAKNQTNANEGGGALYFAAAGGSEVLSNIFWRNKADGSRDDELDQVAAGSGTLDVTYCCVEDCDNGSGGYCFSGGDNNTSSDPLFEDLGNDDYLLQNTNCGGGNCDSPAIDTGDGQISVDAICAATGGFDGLDIRGAAACSSADCVRCVDIDDRTEDIDIGCYERQTGP